ncbi:MAG: imidazoleglycerol-phosphate dehydratase HisB [Clostridia bacterium]|nr:imidazoleglycerol-phosphate dehydratase HisB [Clostridia bacterium]
MDKASLERKTLETRIRMSIEYGSDEPSGLFGKSGVGFFDHMLNSFAVHSGARISLEVSGDLYVDCHHTIEDVGIVLGKLLHEIVQKRGKITRYGCSYIPMDEALARAVIDVSGRSYLVFDYEPKAPMIGTYDAQMTKEFFRAVAFNMGATLHISLLYGQNDHHAVEAIFKAFAHSLKDALQPIDGAILSAKGVL